MLLLHVIIIAVAIHASRVRIHYPGNASPPLILLSLPTASHATPDVASPVRRGASIHPSSATSAAGERRSDAATIDPAPESPPGIDWQYEAELAARHATDSGDAGTYRDLSRLSAAQLSWVRKNHLQPMPPGMHWQRPRLEFDRDTGLPILRINDHCVLVTVLVFCAVGHIEADGDLFRHMRDPRDP